MMTASLRAVAEIVDPFPLRKLIRRKKSLSGVESFKLPIALAEFRSAIFKRLLPFGILFHNTFPPLILLYEESLNQLPKCFADGNFFIPSKPISLMIERIITEKKLLV